MKGDEFVKTEHKDHGIPDDIKTLLNEDKYQLVWIPYHQFEDIREIGGGAFATVYRASYKRTRRLNRLPEFTLPDKLGIHKDRINTRFKQQVKQRGLDYQIETVSDELIEILKKYSTTNILSELNRSQPIIPHQNVLSGYNVHKDDESLDLQILQ
ncbi:18930_t:CDS:2 [Gigaspora rosea]|nr:18930_t:CDS:2 [Gigaspora rosea]